MPSNSLDVVGFFGKKKKIEKKRIEKAVEFENKKKQSGANFGRFWFV
jgi:hypothetical protein